MLMVIKTKKLKREAQLARQHFAHMGLPTRLPFPLVTASGNA